MTYRRTLIWAVTSTALLVILVVALVLISFTEGESQPPRAATSIDPNCHPKTSYELGRWEGDGWSGWYYTCSQMHGPFFAWRNGKLAIRGHYANGKRDGDFIYYNQSGVVVERERYLGGQLISADGG